MFFLLNDGKTYEKIAEFIGCSRRTVAYWCVHGEPNNLESLSDRIKSGNHKKVTEEYLEKLLKLVEISTQELGDDFGIWTGKRLAEHLAQATGILLSRKLLEFSKKNRFTSGQNLLR